MDPRRFQRPFLCVCVKAYQKERRLLFKRKQVEFLNFSAKNVKIDVLTQRQFIKLVGRTRMMSNLFFSCHPNKKRVINPVALA